MRPGASLVVRYVAEWRRRLLIPLAVLAAADGEGPAVHAADEASAQQNPLQEVLSQGRWASMPSRLDHAPSGDRIM